jgi:hypothetical protein
LRFENLRPPSHALELILILVELVLLNEPAGKPDIIFHNLGDPFDAAPEAVTEKTQHERDHKDPDLPPEAPTANQNPRAAPPAIRPAPPGHRRLALTHRIAEEIGVGRYADQTNVARHHGLTRAQLTQMISLLLHGPDIQRGDPRP